MKYAYVGCRTTKERNARGKGIRVFEIDGQSKEWKEIQTLKILENPSYLAFDNDKKYLYTVHGDLSDVSSFKIKDDCTLEYLNTVSTHGKNPVYLAVDDTNQYIVVATLQGGSVLTYKRQKNGMLSEAIDKVRLQGKTEDKVSLAHQCIFDNNKKYVFVPTQGRIQGYGQIIVFELDKKNGKLIEKYKLRSREFAEPRHAAVDQNNRYLYLINEKDSTITFHYFDDSNGKLEPKQIVSTLPETYTGPGQASAVLVHKSNKFLYASNRIHDSIAIFSIDPNTGYIKNIGFESTLGKTPRFFTFDEEGKYLYVANEDSDDIVVFEINQETGLLRYTGQRINTGSPVCILFS